MLESFSLSMVCFMNVDGSARNTLRCLSAAWCFWRNSSRRADTDFMRMPSESRCR
jgi:uncharacterized protein (DUF2225 family)